MDSARIALAALAAVGSGIVLGLAANPTLRTFPELDWRARYRAAATAAPDPAPQPGVSYFGDGSTTWAYGGGPARDGDHLPPVEVAAWNEAAPPVPPPPPPALSVEPTDPYDAEAAAAARAAAQAAVTDALARSVPRETAVPQSQPPTAEQADSPAMPADGEASADGRLGG